MFKKLLWASVLAFASQASIAGPLDFYVVVPLKGKAVAQPGAQAGAQSAIKLGLNAGTLPAGKVGQAYSQGLAAYLAVSGDPAFDLSQVSWSIGAGALPAGLTLSPTGIIAGMPSTKNTAGDSFQVQASYKTQAGVQTYTIVVNGSTSLLVSQISSGDNLTCAVTPTGGVLCWGANWQGQLGDGTTVSSWSPRNVVGLTSGIARVEAGSSHACALTTAGGVKCWGANYSGQLGDGTGASSSVPVEVQGLSSGVSRVVMGIDYSCALMTAGGVKCWGDNSYGQLGDGTMTSRPAPVDVVGLSSVYSLAAGGNHTCAVTVTGGAKCWGDNYSGKLGDGTTTRSAVPVTVLWLPPVVKIFAAGGANTCALTGSGALWCWGSNNSGQLGTGTAYETSGFTPSTPVEVSGLSSAVTEVALGDSFACALRNSAVFCWGANYAGQLGTGTGAPTAAPTAVPGLSSGVTSVSALSSNVCVRTTAGVAKCWGPNWVGQLGDGTNISSTVPVDVLP